MIKVCATDPSEYYLEFLEQRSPNFYWVLIKTICN